MCMDQSLKFQKLKSATKIAYSIHVGLSYQPAGSTHTHTYINVIYINIYLIYIYTHIFFQKYRTTAPPWSATETRTLTQGYPWPQPRAYHDSRDHQHHPLTVAFRRCRDTLDALVPWVRQHWHRSRKSDAGCAGCAEGALRPPGKCEAEKPEIDSSLEIKPDIIYIYNYIIQILSPEVWNANSYPGLV